MVFHSRSLLASLFLSYTLVNLSTCLPPPQAYRPDSCQVKGNALQGAYPDYFISERNPTIYLEWGSVGPFSTKGANTVPAKRLLDDIVNPELQKLRNQKPGEAVPGGYEGALHWPKNYRASTSFDLANISNNPAFTYDIAYRAVQGYSDWIQEEERKGEICMRVPPVAIKGAGIGGKEVYGVVSFAIYQPKTPISY